MEGRRWGKPLAGPFPPLPISRGQRIISKKNLKTVFKRRKSGSWALPFFFPSSHPK